MIWKIATTSNTFTPILIFQRKSLNPPPNKGVVLGVDPGLATTGWGVVEKNKSAPILKAFGAILTSSSLPLPQRLQQIHQDLLEIIDQFTPSVVAIEELFFAKFAVS